MPRAKPSETLDMEVEDLKKQLDEISIEAATARSENERLWNQLDILLKQNEALLANRDERDRLQSENNSRTENGTQTINERINGNNYLSHNSSNASVSTNMNTLENLNTELMRGIINHFEAIQVNINIPTYNGEKGNPAEFIEKVEKYFLRKRIKDDAHKLLAVEDALNDRTRSWFEAQISPFVDFNHLKLRFLKNFYSLEARAERKNSWSTRKYQFSDGSYTEYFTEQRRIAKYFDPPMDSYEMNYHIIKQLPPRAREILSVVNYSETDLIVQALGRMDSSRKENFENKKMVDLNAKGNTSGYRASNQQLVTESSGVNNVQNDGFGRSFRPPRNNSRPEKQNEHDKNRVGINQNW